MRLNNVICKTRATNPDFIHLFIYLKKKTREKSGKYDSESVSNSTPTTFRIMQKESFCKNDAICASPLPRKTTPILKFLSIIALNILQFFLLLTRLFNNSTCFCARVR